MEIQINSCPINFQLENEREVGEVIGSVSQWARERDLVFVEALIDNRSYPLDTIPSLPLDGIQSINCIMQSKADAVISSLQEGMAYCSRAVKFFGTSISGGDPVPSQVKSLAEGSIWLADILITASGLLGIALEEINYKDAPVSSFTGRLREFGRALEDGREGGDVNPLFAANQELFPALKEIFRMMLTGEQLKRLVIQSIDSPDVLIRSIREIRALLGEQVSNISETVMAYQTGKDGAASERLQSFIDFIYLYLRTCYQSAPVFQVDFSKLGSGGVSIDDKNARLHELLNEMLSALENNDIISLSDILEYELKPEMESLDAFLEALLGAVEPA